jgi:predicted Zn finger-like uncharacterized protein
MILTCPSCSARYLLAADAIGENGRAVRCGKCGNVWQQPPIRDSLDELNATDFTTPAEDVTPDPVPDAEPVKEFPVYKVAAEPPETSTLSAFTKLFARPRLMGVAGAIAVFGLLIAIIIYARAPMISAFPSIRPVFETFGLEEDIAARNLIFDNVTAKISDKTLSISGKLINLSDKPVVLPPMTVDILDSASSIVKTYSADIGQKEMDGEASIDLDLSYTDVPGTSHQVRLTFDFTTGAEDAGSIPVHPSGD